MSLIKIEKNLQNTIRIVNYDYYTNGYWMLHKRYFQDDFKALQALRDLNLISMMSRLNLQVNPTKILFEFINGRIIRRFSNGIYIDNLYYEMIVGAVDSKIYWYGDLKNPSSLRIRLAPGETIGFITPVKFCDKLLLEEINQEKAEKYSLELFETD